MDATRDVPLGVDGGTNGRAGPAASGFHLVLPSGGSGSEIESAEAAWAGLVDDLQVTVSGLREQLAAYDPAAPMPARERHDLERALDRYATATGALVRHVEQLLRTNAPRPRR